MKGDFTNSKKLALLYILQILGKYSDADHPLTQEQIIEKLDREYNVVLERKAVASNIRLLRDYAGFDIEEASQRKNEKYAGIFLASRRFEDSELQLLIDSVLFSRHIPQNYADDIIGKLKELGSQYFSKALPSVQSIGTKYRTAGKEIFYIIERLNEAMVNERKVLFMYNEYGIDKMLHGRWEELKTVNPYQIVVANNHYYLIANVDSYDNLVHFRLDKITDIQLTDQPRKSIRQTREGGVDLGRYLLSRPYMFTGQSSRIKIRLPKSQIGLVIDAFGKDFEVSDTDAEFAEVDLIANEADVYFWALQNGDEAEVLEPQNIRNQLRRTVSAMERRYLKNNQDRYFEAIEDARFGKLELCRMKVKGKIEREDLPGVYEAVISETDLTDVSFLQKCTRLNNLFIDETRVSDLSFLDQFPYLKELDIRVTNVSSIEFLKGMSLKSLILAANPIVDYSPLYTLKSLESFETDPATIQEIDVEKLRSIYPGIQIAVVENLFFSPIADYSKKAEGKYPYNVLRQIFGGDAVICGDPKAMEDTLKKVIHQYLSKEETEVLLQYCRDGRSINDIASAWGVTPNSIYVYYSKILRKLRHPRSSKQLRQFIVQRDGS